MSFSNNTLSALVILKNNNTPSGTVCTTISQKDSIPIQTITNNKYSNIQSESITTKFNSTNKWIPLPSIMTCENMIIKAIDDLKDYMRRGSSFHSIMKYIQANFLLSYSYPDHQSSSSTISLHLRNIIFLSLKSLLIQGHVSYYPSTKHRMWGNSLCGGSGYYKLSKALKRKRLYSMNLFHHHKKTCRSRLLGRQTVHPWKEKHLNFIHTGGRVKRKVFITKCKLSNSKILSVTCSFLFKNEYMDLDDENHKKIRRRRIFGGRRRHKSSSLVKTQLFLRKNFHVH